MSGPGFDTPDYLAPIKVTFFQECADLLNELETGLLALQAGERDAEIVNTVFRAVHSIKGGAASFGLEQLVHFAHRFETALSEIRSGRLSLNGDILNILLRASDMLADKVRVARDGGSLDEKHAGALEEALEALIPLRPSGTPSSLPGVEASSWDAQESRHRPGEERTWTIRFGPRARLYANANETLLLFRELRQLGEMQVVLNESSLPNLDALDPEQSYFTWTILLKTTTEQSAIRDVFEFVELDCDLEIRASAPPAGRKEKKPESFARPFKPQGGAKPAATPDITQTRPVETIRVDLERVDRLVNLVSELVINQAMLAQRVAMTTAAEPGAELPLDELNHLTREIQDSVMAIRSQPVKVVFHRMSRLAREASAATGKQVVVAFQGEATEVDRTVIERLTDPLTHMIRNAIDHGIETPKARIAANKPMQGTIGISAAHRSGRIVITVVDDGRGIDRVRVRDVAIRQGLVPPDGLLSDQEIDNLIFVPGFSTASEISALSGRGVGMDVVKRGVQALGGRISVSSKPGLGTTFALTLPLTLAVLDGMAVSVAGQTLIAPVSTLLESVQPKPRDLKPVGSNAVLMRFRDEYMPLIDLGVLLGYRTEVPPVRGIAILVEDDFGARAAFLVDEILGQRQVVIKSLQANYRQVEGIAAATILGDGQVALILDVNAIVASRRRYSSMEQKVAAG